MRRAIVLAINKSLPPFVFAPSTFDCQRSAACFAPLSLHGITANTSFAIYKLTYIAPAFAASGPRCLLRAPSALCCCCVV